MWRQRTPLSYTHLWFGLEVLEVFSQRICLEGSHENYSEFVKLKTAICALGLITTVGLSAINCLFE